MMLVVDYASVDGGGPPDAKAAYAAGVRVAIIRRSECHYDAAHRAWRLAPDTAYARDAQIWRDAGVVVGSYAFWALHKDAPSIAEQVANLFAAPGEIQPGVDLPPASDVEFPGRGVPDSGLSQAECLQLVKDADAALTTHLNGRRPLTYTSHVQWCDDNGLGGPAWDQGGDSPLWIKTPYRLGAGQPLDQVVPHQPHAGTVAWDPHDYWRYPPPWEKRGHWLHQWQGDCAGFPGFDHRVDVGSFNPFDLGAPMAQRDGRWSWVICRVGTMQPSPLDALKVFQAARGLVADGVIGAKTFAALAWA